MERVGPFQKGVVCFSKEYAFDQGGEISTYFHSSSERRLTQLFLEKMEPFHDRQADTSFPVPLSQYSNISNYTLPIFPKKAEIGFPKWENIQQKALKELYTLFLHN